MRTTLHPTSPEPDPLMEVRAFAAVTLSLAIVALAGFAALGGLAPFSLHRLADAQPQRLRAFALGSLVVPETPAQERSVPAGREPLVLAAATPAPAAPAPQPAAAAAQEVAAPAAEAPPAAAPAPEPAPAAQPAPETPAVEEPAPSAPVVTPSPIIPAAENGGSEEPAVEKPGNGPKDVSPSQGKSDPPGNANGHDKAAGGNGNGADNGNGK